MPAIRPFLQLEGRESVAKPRALVVGQAAAEYREIRYCDTPERLVEEHLQLLRGSLEHLAPVGQDEILTHALRRQGAGAKRLGKKLDAHALPDWLKHRREIGAAQGGDLVLAAWEFHALCEGLAAIESRCIISGDDADGIWKDALSALVRGWACEHAP